MFSDTPLNPGDSRQLVHRQRTTSRHRRLRRGLGTFAIALAVPAALATSQASAYNIAPADPPVLCFYQNAAFSEGSVFVMPGNQVKECIAGKWTPVTVTPKN
jgi:hypothetical protein